MANKMEVHVTVSGVVAHNPGQHPLPAGAGQSVVATGKPQDKTATVHGQISGTSIIAHNPA